MIDGHPLPQPPGTPYLRTEAARAKALGHCHDHGPPAPCVVRFEVSTTDGLTAPQFVYPSENLRCIIGELMLDPLVSEVRPTGGITDTGTVLTVLEVTALFEARNHESQNSET